MRVWRIASAAHTELDGEGARRFGSRWTPRGLRAVFTSATLSLAALERFINADPDLEPAELLAIAIDIDRRAAIEIVTETKLPPGWRTYPAPPALAEIGARWLRSSPSAILSVPSAVIPSERNFILNPAHANFGKLTVHPGEPFRFDPRMWKRK